MNTLEKKIYDLVKRNPRLKLLIRNTYQKLLDIVPIKRMKSEFPINIREGYFFGFHDKCPFSADDSMLLGAKYNIPLRTPTVKDELILGYFDGPNFESFHKVATTNSWNWHQGCQMQWRGSSSEIVFNDFNGERNIAKRVNIRTAEEKILSRAISTVSPDGSWGAGYSFERVQKYMPGYGYLHGECNDVEHPAPDSDGLYYIDLETGDSKLIVSLAEVAKIEDNSLMSNGKHYISHAIISPGSNRVMFLHRWVKKDLRMRWSRMFACNKDGSNLHLFPTYEMVSHMGWRNKDQILAYCRLKDGADGYVLFNDLAIEKYQPIGASSFNSDGHPSYDRSGRWIITDTYPDRFRIQRLILYDSIKNKRTDLAKLYHPKDFVSTLEKGHLTCDLHPRWNRAGTMVCFDSAYTGRRSLCTMDVKSLTK